MMSAFALRGGGRVKCSRRRDPVKIAVTGKGGVGKSTVAAAIALLRAGRGERVLAVDADPDANLATALGIPAADQARIVTIARHRTLIEERTGASPGYGQMFKLNPDVSDIADTYAYAHRGVSLLVLGAVERGGGGCACAESTLLRALVQDMVLSRGENLIMDMEAGIEHLGRSTAAGVDALLVVAEPGQRSVESVLRIARMASEIGLSRVYAVFNKVRSPGDEAFLRQSLGALEPAGSIPFSERLLAADRDGVSVIDAFGAAEREAFEGIMGVLDRGVR
jgi:CO dehydrogenase maturation factor